MLYDGAEVAARRAEYIQELFDDDKPNSAVPSDRELENRSSPEDCQPITMEEMRAAMRQMANNKAAGEDGVTTEMLRSMGEAAHNKLLLLNAIYRTAELFKTSVNQCL